MNAKQLLKLGNKYPYDAIGESDVAMNPNDPAFRAARGVLADLGDRRGLSGELDDIDYELRGQIVESLAAIIREAYKK